MVSTAQTLPQIKSQEFIGHIEKHLITTSPLTCVTNGIPSFVNFCMNLVDYNLPDTQYSSGSKCSSGAWLVSDLSLLKEHMMNPLSCFSCLSMLHNWHNKGILLSYWWDGTYKRSLAAYQKSSP